MTDHIFCINKNLPENRSTRFGLEDVGAKIKMPVSWAFEPNFCNTAKRNVIIRCKSLLIHYLYICVIPENIHTSPTEVIFSKTAHPLWKLQLSFIHFFKFFWSCRTPHPPGNSNPLCGGSMDIFWNCTFKLTKVINYQHFPKPIDEKPLYICFTVLNANVVC